MCDHFGIELVCFRALTGRYSEIIHTMGLGITTSRGALVAVHKKVISRCPVASMKTDVGLYLSIRL